MGEKRELLHYPDAMLLRPQYWLKRAYIFFLYACFILPFLPHL